MKSILVPTDFSQESTAAFRVAREQAKILDSARIEIVYVLELPAYLSSPAELGAGWADTGPIIKDLEAAAINRLKNLAAEHFPGLKIDLKVLHSLNPIAVQLTEYAKSSGIDMLVMATHGRRGVNRMLVGSVTERLVRRPPCAMLIVPVRA